MEDSKSGVVTVWVSDGQNAIIAGGRGRSVSGFGGGQVLAHAVQAEGDEAGDQRDRGGGDALRRERLDLVLEPLAMY
jgi:hypothetical protein